MWYLQLCCFYSRLVSHLGGLYGSNKFLELFVLFLWKISLELLERLYWMDISAILIFNLWIWNIFPFCLHFDHQCLTLFSVQISHLLWLYLLLSINILLFWCNYKWLLLSSDSSLLKCWKATIFRYWFCILQTYWIFISLNSFIEKLMVFYT